MNGTKILFILLTIFSINVKIHSQNNKGDYKHKSTNFTFPQTIGEYKRSSLTVFDKKDLNIRAFYQSVENTEKTNFTIHVYPAGVGTDTRLRYEYLKSIKSFSNITGSSFVTNFPVSFQNSGYKINGIKAEYSKLNSKSCISVFECGRWFFKIIITTQSLDSIQIETLETRILDVFIPTKLVQAYPLNPKADINFAKSAFADSIMLGSVMGSALKKLEWVFDNVDSLERASGFPGLYLEMYITAFTELAEFDKRFPNTIKSKSTDDYLRDVKKIINSGFLPEYIMDKYNWVLIIPSQLKLDLDGYKKWKAENPTLIDLPDRFYSIYFDK